MKIRSCVLVACMVVVPGLALFSHLTPPAARDFLRCTVCDPLCRAISAIDAVLPFGSAATLSGGPPSSAPPRPGPADSLVAIVADPVEPVEPANVMPPTATSAQPAGAIANQPPTAVTLAEVAPAATPSTGRDLPRSQAEWATLAALRKQLAALGASGIDCRPQPGNMTGYTSTCRIGIDAAGQLHRMFHGQGLDAPSAMRSLIDQIQAWQVQQAGTPRQRF